MRKAFLDQLRLLNSMIGNLKNMRTRLNHCLLENQVSLVSKDPMTRIICARRLVLAELTLRILKHSREDLSFAAYVDELTSGVFSFCLDLCKENPIRIPEEYTRNPFGPFWVWLACNFVAIRSVSVVKYATTEVDVLINLRYTRLCESIIGYPRQGAYYYGTRVRRPLIRFAEIDYTCSCFPCGGLPKGRLVDAEVAPAVFDSEV